MPPKLQMIYDFLYSFEQAYVFSNEKRPKGGRPKTYTHSSFILFFISMFLRGIFQFKTMARMAESNYAHYGFPKAPSRKTIRERLKKLPPVIVYMIPQIANFCYQKLDHKLFSIKCLFSDKSIFRAKGGLWHAKHIKLGIVPHSSIDTEASWSKSPYHGWRFGYALLLVTNQKRFPVAAMADTGKLDEPRNLVDLIRPLLRHIGIIVGDAAYKVYEIIKVLFNQYDVLLLTNTKVKDKSMKWYKDLIQLPVARLLYSKRKPSVEPTFALIKELFNLKGETQLPYKGKKYVVPFLLITAITIQIMAVYNYKNQNNLGYSFEFRNLF